MESPSSVPKVSSGTQLSNAEQKKLRKAEKSARREGKKKLASNAGNGEDHDNKSNPKVKIQNVGTSQASANQTGQGGGIGDQTSFKLGPDTRKAKHAENRGNISRRRSSVNLPEGSIKQQSRNRGTHTMTSNANKDSEIGRREVALFGHLYGHRRRITVDGAPKEVHPSILALGLKMSSYAVCGSNARCVAMLIAFKLVIESYTTPPGTSLARHLTSHHLSPQIDFLRSCRPISVSMGNAIRWLKEQIIKIDPAVPEAEAKLHLLSCIDTFIRERITAADAVISDTASAKICNGDVVLTYAHSSVVAATILVAHRNGTRFRVIVIDSRPLFEGRRLARKLSAAGVCVSYTLMTAASHVVSDATRVFLGAHAMLGNGRLYSRVGTAAIAMLAHERDIPVIICCESVKFSDRVALDSIVSNEIAPAEELVIANCVDGVSGENAVESEAESALHKWTETPNLQMLNILYDVTPAEYITMVVTELGSLPPSSVPVVHRISTNG